MRSYVQSYVLDAAATGLPRAAEDLTAVVDEFEFDDEAACLRFWTAWSQDDGVEAIRGRLLDPGRTYLFACCSHIVFEAEA